MTTKQARTWTDAIQKEDNLRLRWFVRNEEQIRESAEQGVSLVSDAQHEQLAQIQKSLVATNERKIRRDPGELLGPEVDPGALTNIMRPIAKETHAMIYQAGRVAYLKHRYHTLPERRYYFPETSSFAYGWKMWECAKTMEGKRYGKSAIIRQSFYRRRAGIEKDPDWYRAPTRLSPTVCNDAN